MAQNTHYTHCAPGVCLMSLDLVPVSLYSYLQSNTGKPYLVLSFARGNDEKSHIFIYSIPKIHTQEFIQWI
jgi:hypothetical protein